MIDDVEYQEFNSLFPPTLITPTAVNTSKIRAGESVKFVVKFTSWNIGTFELPLTFETVGTGKRHQLHVSGHCALPSINADPRNVFMRRVKHRPEGGIPPVSKRFVVSRGQYEFGPLLTWKRAEKRQEGASLLLHLVSKKRESCSCNCGVSHLDCWLFALASPSNLYEECDNGGPDVKRRGWLLLPYRDMILALRRAVPLKVQQSR